MRRSYACFIILKLLIKAQIEDQSQEYNSCKEFIKKLINTKAKTSL